MGLTKITTINVDATEQVAGLIWIAVHLKGLCWVVVLAVDVATYGDRGIYFEKGTSSNHDHSDELAYRKTFTANLRVPTVSYP